jgi:hypothetical protein
VEAAVTATPEAAHRRAPLCILYLHHRDDAVTRHHFDLVRRHNPRAVVVPLVDEPHGALPGAIDVSRLPTPWNTSDKWRSCDTMIYRWFSHRTCEADHYLVLEYDCRADIDLLALYRPYLDGDVVVAHWQDRALVPEWHWFGEVERLAPDERALAAGVTPIATTLFTHDALARVCAHVSTADLFSELRLGTAIRKAGLRVRELPRREGARIDWREYRRPILGPGLYHPIKAVHHNRRLALRLWRRLAAHARSLPALLAARLNGQ